jgi:DNA repair protein RecO (recombination protein O)
MIRWSDEALLLSVTRHGEANAIIEVFCESQGRHAGIVRGGGGRRMAPILQPGATLQVEWSARIEDHLGTFKVEPVTSRAALLADRGCLSAMTALTTLIRETLPERETVPGFYDLSLSVLDAMPGQDWPVAYALWEMQLLQELGFGLDLSQCAVTGTTENLRYVSPKSGRAVSVEGAGDWVNRLLRLPPFLRGEGQGATTGDVLDSLTLTGFFLKEHVIPDRQNRSRPDPRDALIGAIERHT